MSIQIFNKYFIIPNNYFPIFIITIPRSCPFKELFYKLVVLYLWHIFSFVYESLRKYIKMITTYWTCVHEFVNVDGMCLKHAEQTLVKWHLRSPWKSIELNCNEAHFTAWVLIWDFDNLA